MLAIRLILMLVQLAAAYAAAPFVTRLLPNLGQFNLFTYAVIVALIVWLVGLATAMLLRDLRPPSMATLWASLVLALIGAALTFVPAVTGALAGVAKGVPLVAYPLIGAVLGYAFKR